MAQAQESKFITEVFVDGVRKGWKIATTYMMPNLVMAFVLIKILNMSGILGWISEVCGPIMAVFGLPGEAITILLGAWMSTGGGVGVACALFEQGVIDGTQLAIVTPAIFLTGAQIQYLGRILGVIGIKGKMLGICMLIPPVMAILSMFVMRVIVM